MNIKIVKNKYLNTLLLLMLFSAMVHMLILVCFAIASLDINVLNYFNILEISSLSPDFFNSFAGNILSFVCMALLYGLIFKINKE